MQRRDWDIEVFLEMIGKNQKIFQHSPEFGKILGEYLLKFVKLPNLAKPNGFG